MTAKKATGIFSTPEEKRVSTSSKSKAVKRAPVKKAAKKTTRSKVQKPNKVAPEITSTIDLPTNMSQRSIEKSLVLKREFDSLYRGYVMQLAKVVSLCFMLVGAALVFSSFVPTPTHQMSALLTSSSTLTTTVQPTTITLATPIPAVITSDTLIAFTANNAQNVKASLRQIGATGFYDLPTKKIAPDTFESTIWWASYPGNYYELLIYAVPADGSPTVTYKSQPFQIGYIITTTSTTNSTSTTTTSTSGSGTSGTSGTSGGSTSTSSGSTTSGSGSTSSGSTSSGSGSTSSGTGSSGTSSSDDTVTGSVITTTSGTNSTIDTSIKTPFALFTTDDKVLTGTEIVGVSTPDEYTYLELYARPINSVNSRFITLATKRSIHWQFIVNSENIPNGDYEFFAQTKYNGSVITSDSIRLRVSNSATSLDTTTNTQPKTTTTIAPTSPTTQDTTTSYERPLYVVTDETRSFASSSPQLMTDVERETQQLLQTNEVNFSTLFERYAAAQQSGDEALIRLAEEALADQQQRLADTALHDPRLQDIADNIDTNLFEQVEKIKGKIVAFEGIRREKSSGDTAKDTDGDGISDIDEITLYKTNPAAADSDNDGINDGVEIVRGFDPNNDTPEAIIRFESPKETVGLTRPSSLTIDEVRPLLALQASDEQPAENQVATEIRGRALPNSFVTLYIFSTPVVVTVKTDADGSFVYNFDRELEDGRHDVYVAVTDNTGEIIAQSNPFSFVKKAQAFTPVDAAGSEVVSSETFADTSGASYSLVIGVAILALGFILLMLGISLRGKSEEVVITEKQESNETSSV